MGWIVLILLVIIGIAALCSYFVASMVYSSRVKKDPQNIAGARATRTAIVIIGTIILTAVIIYLLVSNIHLSRG